jgi:trimeric autotransporter adhesin
MSLRRPGRRASAATTMILAPMLLASAAAAQYVENRYWVTDGSVNAVLPTDETVYLGGSFTQVSPATGAGVVLDTATAEVRRPYPLVDGVVHAVAPDGAGGWFVGGQFSRAGARDRESIAHVDASGEVTGWNPGVAGIVRALLVSGGRVYVGGDFITVGGLSRTYLASIDANTGAVTAWAPNPSGRVWALTSTNSSTVIAAGEFTTIAGVARGRVAEINTSTGVCTSFNPNANGAVYTVWARVTTDVATSRLYVGGDFTTLGGQPRARIGATDLFGTLLSYNPGADGAVRTVRTTFGAFSAHTVYLGGSFSLVGGQPRNALASTNAAGTLTSWNPGADSTVHSLVVAGSTIYVGGDFTVVAGVARRRVAGIDTAGAATPWDPRANGPVHALALWGSQLFAGGNLTGMGGVMRDRLAALDRHSGAATDWAPSADGPVYTLAHHHGVVYAGGDFQFINGLARFHLAGFDASTGQTTNWNPVANGPVFVMVPDGGTILIGGEFTVVGGALRSRLAELDIASFTVTGWNPGADRTVYELVLHDRTTPVPTTTVFAGGLFTSAGGATRSRVAELDRTTGAATSWNPPSFEAANSGYFVGTIVPADPFVYVGGAFYEVGGQPRAGIAALYSDTGQLSGWNANTVFPCQVYAMALGGEGLFVGGFFQQIGGVARDGLAVIDPFSAMPKSWDAATPAVNIGNSIAALAIDGPTVFVGGSFRSMAGSPRSGFAALSLEPVAVQETRAHAAGLAVTAWPNPTRARTELRWRSTSRASTEIVVHDVRGRVVRRFGALDLPGGDHRLVWDGRDDQGRSVSAGVYFARLRSGTRNATVKIVRLH